MGWHIYEKLLEKVANYSPFVGKIWIVFLFIFRLIVVTSVGDTIYDDEQSEFVCNTNDPGCQQFCFTKFAPVSQIRFFAMQLLFVGTPSMIFIVYTLHKITLLPSQDSGDQKPDENQEQSGALGLGDAGYRSRGRRGKGGRRRRRRKRLKYLREHLEVDPETKLPKYNDVILHPETKDELITRHVHLAKGKLRLSKDDVIASSDDSDTTSDDDSSSPTSSDIDKLAIKLKSATGPSAPSSEPPSRQKKVKTQTVYHPDGNDEIYKTRSISRAYFIQAILRLAIEAGFIYLQYIMYGIEVNWFFDCTGEPCTKEIRCYVSRPKEKTYLLLFMYVMEGLSVLFCLCEIVVIVYSHLTKRKKRNAMTSMPLQQVVSQQHADSRSGGQVYRRAVHNLNTFPDLGPYPLIRDNNVGGGSTHDVIQSNHNGYYR